MDIEGIDKITEAKIGGKNVVEFDARLNGVDKAFNSLKRKVELPASTTNLVREVDWLPRVFIITLEKLRKHELRVFLKRSTDHLTNIAPRKRNDTIRTSTCRSTVFK